ncbi:MAG: arsenate reductase family protein [Clostridia bacterium]
MILIGYSKCTTCKSAIKWLEENNQVFTFREIKDENPSIEELKDFHQKSDLPLKRLFNTSGLIYKSLGLKDKLPNMSDEEQFELLATDGMLVKRPLLILDDKVLIGFKPKQWVEELL